MSQSGILPFLHFQGIASVGRKINGAEESISQMNKKRNTSKIYQLPDAWITQTSYISDPLKCFTRLRPEMSGDVLLS